MVILNAFDATTSLPLNISEVTLLSKGEFLGAIILTTESYPHEADLVYNVVKDEYLVVSRQEYGNLGDWDIWGARVDAGFGNVADPTGVFKISQYNEIEQSPRVATNG